MNPDILNDEATVSRLMLATIHVEAEGFLTAHPVLILVLGPQIQFPKRSVF
jgi:hypothetical protein